MFVPGEDAIKEEVIEPGSMAYGSMGMNRGNIIKRSHPTPTPDVPNRVPIIRPTPTSTTEAPLYQSSYTKEDVESMDDDTIITCFQLVVLHGASMLYCTHCKKHTEIDPNWLESIPIYCKKRGICEGSFPKTCDERQRYNRLTNPISNAHYPKLRTAETTEEYGELVTSRAIAIAQLGFVPSPTKYVM